MRNLEVIGEACRNIERIDPDFAARHPDLPLRAASGMRNLLSHGYFAIDLDIVWTTVKTSLPSMEQQVRRIAAELNAGQLPCGADEPTWWPPVRSWNTWSFSSTWSDSSGTSAT